MSKNFPALHASANDSVALEQKIYVKLESVRGTMVLPTGSDFIYHIGGGSVNFVQPIESSPHKSGRHHTSVIKQKTETTWTIPTFFNIDTTLGSASPNEISAGMKVLHKSMFGYEDLSTSPVYNTSQDPDITFTIMEIGDVWAKQAPGCFVEACNMTFPGDGQAQAEWSGMGKTVLLVGIGKSVTNNNANTVTLATGEGKRFPVGAKVMIIKDDNTKSTDTPAGTARTVTSVTGDVVTVDGAVLADADGTTDPVYLVYYEPESPTSINDPQTGLQGSITIAGFGAIDNCVRSLSISAANNHELQDFCYGEEGLGGPLFTPGGRFTAEVSIELNLNKELVAFINNLKEFDGDDITLILGDATSRHLQIEIPKVIFPIPEIPVPETGTIPVTFTGNAYQTALDAADEITLSYL
jgi:hypothetical protein